MKLSGPFYLLFVVAAGMLPPTAVATPAPSLQCSAPADTGHPLKTCPPGYQCCGPFQADGFGSCIVGKFAACPLVSA